MHKFVKKFIATTTLLTLCAALTVPSYAEVTKYILKAEDNVYYEYDYDKLQDSYLNHILGFGDTKIYDHFNGILEDGGRYSAIFDSIRGYVDYNDVKNAYTDALIIGQSFDVNEYTENDAELNTSIQSVKLVEQTNGEIVLEDKEVQQSVDFLFEDLGSAVGIGMTVVKVTLSTNAPDEYDVRVGEVTLVYKGNSVFAGEVPKADATKEKVYISKKDQNLDREFQVISIE